MTFVTAPPVSNLEFSADEMRRMQEAVKSLRRAGEHIAGATGIRATPGWGGT